MMPPPIEACATEEAASRCGCESEDLCPGPLAGIDEGDKIRTIYDGSVGGANDTIRNQTVERTTAPTVLDGVQALHWLHAAAAEGPPSQGASGPEGGVVKPPPGGWLWGTRWVLLKADVTKAHRRVKVLRKKGLAGGRMVGEQGRHIWHGQCPILLAALLLRVLYALFPQVDWNFVFVNDFLWLLRSEGAVNLAVALLATLLALGTPLSWKKTHLAEVNTWLGFVVHPNIPPVLMAANKHILVMEVLQTMVEGQAMHSKNIEKALGRIQWATAACPLAKSMLQPRWGNPPRWSGCWRSRCGSSSTRPSSSTPPTCRSPLGGVAAMLAPRTTDWHLWEVGAPTKQEGGVLVP